MVPCTLAEFSADGPCFAATGIREAMKRAAAVSRRNVVRAFVIQER